MMIQTVAEDCKAIATDVDQLSLNDSSDWDQFDFDQWFNDIQKVLKEHRALFSASNSTEPYIKVEF